jgi:hypothetical protein
LGEAALMQILQVGDVSFVKNWHRGYGDADPLTKVPWPKLSGNVFRYTNSHGPMFIDRPTDAFCAAQFPAIDALIKTPVAFAILSPMGWAGETSWYGPEQMIAGGWEPLFWKESTHKDKTWVQLFGRFLDRSDLTEKPVFKQEALSIGYSKHNVITGELPYLGCSSHLLCWDTPQSEIKFDLPEMYGGVDPQKCLLFLRVARPLSLTAIEQLKREGYSRVANLRFNQYWVKGRKGLGSREECEY